MSGVAKGWAGITVALLGAAALATTDLVHNADEWAEFEAADLAADYQTASAGVTASIAGLPAVSASGEAIAGAPTGTGEFHDVIVTLEDYGGAGAPAALEAGDDLERAGVVARSVAMTARSAAAAARATQPVAELHEASRLRVAQSGHFVPNRAAAELFESYYRAYPGSSDDLVRGRIVLALIDGLPPRAADEAIDVLDRWRNARAAERALGADASHAERERARRTELGEGLAVALHR